MVAGAVFVPSSAKSSFSVEVQGMLALWQDLSRIIKYQKPLALNANRDQKGSGSRKPQGFLDANLFRHTGWQL